MSNKPKITFATNPNPRNRALIDGLISIDGYDLEYVGDKYTPGEMHYRFVQGEFDVAEMSTATLMRAKEKGKPYLALPIFFQRGPRQRPQIQPFHRPQPELQQPHPRPVRAAGRLTLDIPALF